MGAEAIRTLLRDVDLEKECAELKEKYAKLQVKNVLVQFVA